MSTAMINLGWCFTAISKSKSPVEHPISINFFPWSHSVGIWFSLSSCHFSMISFLKVLSLLPSVCVLISRFKFARYCSLLSCSKKGFKFVVSCSQVVSYSASTFWLISRIYCWDLRISENECKARGLTSCSETFTIFVVGLEVPTTTAPESFNFLFFAPLADLLCALLWLRFLFRVLSTYYKLIPVCCLTSSLSWGFLEGDELFINLLY